MVEQVFSGGFEEAMRWCACALMEARYCVPVYAMLCSVHRILPHRKCAKNETRLSRVLNTALDLPAAALCIEWRVRGSKVCEI